MVKLRKDLPKAMTPHVWADGSQPTARGLGWEATRLPIA